MPSIMQGRIAQQLLSSQRALAVAPSRVHKRAILSGTRLFHQTSVHKAEPYLNFTDTRLEKLDHKVDNALANINTRFKEFGLMIDTRFNKIDTRFDNNDTRFDKFGFEVDSRFNKIDLRFNKIDIRFNKIDTLFDKIDTRFDKSELMFEKLNVEVFQRMESWIIRLLYGTIAVLVSSVGMLYYNMTMTEQAILQPTPASVEVHKPQKVATLPPTVVRDSAKHTTLSQ